MKKFILFAFVLLAMVNLKAQAPQAVPFQAVARDGNGNLVANTPVALRFSIHDVSSNGTVVYKETQSVTTNAKGMFTANIGTGAPVIGTFSAINWGSNAKYQQVEIDITNGINYVD